MRVQAQVSGERPFSLIAQNILSIVLHFHQINTVPAIVAVLNLLKSNDGKINTL